MKQVKYIAIATLVIFLIIDLVGRSTSLITSLAMVTTLAILTWSAYLANLLDNREQESKTLKELSQVSSINRGLAGAFERLEKRVIALETLKEFQESYTD